MKKSRKKAKKQLARDMKRYYDVNTQNNQYWKPAGSGSVSADATGQRAGEKLRAIARNLDENLDICSGVLDVLVKKICGAELRLIPSVQTTTGKALKKLNKDIERLWLDFSIAPETTTELSMAEAQRLACRSWLRDGEMLVHHVKKSNGRHDVSYTMEMLEADYLPFYDSAMETSKKVPIISGVQKNNFGAPVAYFVYKQHPGSITYVENDDKTQLKRVPAGEMIHLKLCKRLRQTRGIPILATVLRRFEDLKDLEESERIKSRLQSSFSAAITKSTEFATTSNDTDGKRTLAMQSGMIFDDLLPGESIAPIGATSPNIEITDWRNGQLRAIASGTSTAYSAISQNYDGSYSSMRQELQDAKVNYEILRCQFINDFLNPVFNQFISMAVAGGLLSIPTSTDMNTLRMPQWSIPATPWIDPKKETEADILLIDNEIVSKSAIQRKMGVDPKAMQLEIDTEPKPVKPEMKEQQPEKEPEDEEEAA
jgi:lambda family phage portal protein